SRELTAVSRGFGGETFSRTYICSRTLYRKSSNVRIGRPSHSNATQPRTAVAEIVIRYTYHCMMLEDPTCVRQRHRPACQGSNRRRQARLLFGCPPES